MDILRGGREFWLGLYNSVRNDFWSWHPIAYFVMYAATEVQNLYFPDSSSWYITVSSASYIIDLPWIVLVRDLVFLDGSSRLLSLVRKNLSWSETSASRSPKAKMTLFNLAMIWSQNNGSNRKVVVLCSPRKLSVCSQTWSPVRERYAWHWTCSYNGTWLRNRFCLFLISIIRLLFASTPSI